MNMSPPPTNYLSHWSAAIYTGHVLSKRGKFVKQIRARLPGSSVFSKIILYKLTNTKIYERCGAVQIYAVKKNKKRIDI
jgi:hypothetical protein